MLQILAIKIKGMKKEIRGMILHDEKLSGILMEEEGDGYLSKHVMQIRRLLTSKSKRTGPMQIFAALLLSN